MKRQPGRPPLDAEATVPSADVHLKLRAVDYDALARRAKAQRESIQDVIRRNLKRLLEDERG